MTDLEAIMNDITSVNPHKVDNFGYGPPYIRKVLEKHLNHTAPCEHKRITKDARVNNGWYCSKCGVPKVEASDKKIEKLPENGEYSIDDYGQLIYDKLNEVIDRINQQ